jgi:hypothetical protein
MVEIDQAGARRTETPEAAATRQMLELMRHQAGVTEEIRDQFAEHLELQRQILHLLMAERH